MDKKFSTLEQRSNSSFGYWNRAVADTYFDMHLSGVVAQMPVAAEVGSGDERDELGSG